MKSAADHLGVLSEVPVDILCELLLPMLSVKDVIYLSCTSKAMRVICLEEPLWMNLCLANVKGNLTLKVRVLPRTSTTSAPASLMSILSIECEAGIVEGHSHCQHCGKPYQSSFAWRTHDCVQLLL